MTHVFDEALRQIRHVSADSKKWGADADDIFLERLTAIERHLAAEALRLADDTEFPPDLAQAIRECVAALSVSPADSPAQPFGAQQAVVLHTSPMLTQLHELFHELARRRVTTRFGLLTDDPHDNALRLQRLNAVPELDDDATCPTCDSINIAWKDEPRTVECYDCGHVFTPGDAHKRQA
jgi:hypothetical protein